MKAPELTASRSPDKNRQRVAQTHTAVNDIHTKIDKGQNTSGVVDFLASRCCACK
jgi:hypothetical protein